MLPGEAKPMPCKDHHLDPKCDDCALTIPNVTAVCAACGEKQRIFMVGFEKKRVELFAYVLGLPTMACGVCKHGPVTITFGGLPLCVCGHAAIEHPSHSGGDDPCVGVVMVADAEVNPAKCACAGYRAAT
jgi:hypothetical protein